MRAYRFTKSLQCEQHSIADIIAELATSKSDVPLRSAAALAQVCHGVITGEGPTVVGRVHFSRAIDADDTALCARILILAGRGGDPISRAEADALFDINAVAAERRDGGMAGASMISFPRRSYITSCPLADVTCLAARPHWLPRPRLMPGH
jgi:hypothetical protein